MEVGTGLNGSWLGPQEAHQGTNVSPKKEIGGRGRERKGQECLPPSEAWKVLAAGKMDENKGVCVDIMVGTWGWEGGQMWLLAKW